MDALDTLIYHAMAVPALKRLFVRVNTADRSLDVVARRLKRRSRVLDVGCGLGFSAAVLKEAGHDVRGLEVDKGLCMATEKRFGIPCVKAGAAKIPFAKNTFDHAIMNCVFHHIRPAEHRKSLQEIARVLKPTGSLVMVEPRRDSLRDWLFDKLFYDRDFYGYFTFPEKYVSLTPSKQLVTVPQKELSRLRYVQRKPFR